LMGCQRGALLAVNWHIGADQADLSLYALQWFLTHQSGIWICSDGLYQAKIDAGFLTVSEIGEDTGGLSKCLPWNVTQVTVVYGRIQKIVVLLKSNQLDLNSIEMMALDVVTTHAWLLTFDWLRHLSSLSEI
jgi:hypothetical protein